MKKTHTSLSPTTNMILIVVWGLVAGVLSYFLDSHVAVTMALAGCVLGAAGGIMQHLGLKEATGRLLDASSLLEIRGALMGTKWGKRFIYWIYFTKVVLAILAFAMIRSFSIQAIFSYAVGYMCFMFVREIVTLRDTFRLRARANGL